MVSVASVRKSGIAVGVAFSFSAGVLAMSAGDKSPYDCWVEYKANLDACCERAPGNRQTCMDGARDIHAACLNNLDPGWIPGDPSMCWTPFQNRLQECEDQNWGCEEAENNCQQGANGFLQWCIGHNTDVFWVASTPDTLIAGSQYTLSAATPSFAVDEVTVWIVRVGVGPAGPASVLAMGNAQFAGVSEGQSVWELTLPVSPILLTDRAVYLVAVAGEQGDAVGVVVKRVHVVPF